ncbi:hypothetical protein POTOM_041834 [Populus tomentosa]|uniref:Uncharacterized protein n=1 Tax=Populus tomentosa TaxID=118781 RepID=A0A8X8CHP9_POPTO|nr:hypothetical protein POTOM_041834 [Populus tomentosa]
MPFLFPLLPSPDKGQPEFSILCKISLKVFETCVPQFLRGDTKAHSHHPMVLWSKICQITGVPLRLLDAARQQLGF